MHPIIDLFRFKCFQCVFWVYIDGSFPFLLFRLAVNSQNICSFSFSLLFILFLVAGNHFDRYRAFKIFKAKAHIQKRGLGQKQISFLRAYHQALSLFSVKWVTRFYNKLIVFISHSWIELTVTISTFISKCLDCDLVFVNSFDYNN